MTTVYREDDPISARWAGLGRLLTKYEMDLNHYQFDTRITTLETNYVATVSLASVSQPSPSTLLFTKTDASTDGPFNLPVAVFNDQGNWAIDTPYLVNDTFNAPDGGLYRVIFDHTSSHISFDPAANDGMGHDYYASMIPPRGNTIPAGGAVGMYFRKNSVVDYVANWAFIQASEVGYDASTESSLSADNVFDALDELDAKAVALDIRVDALEATVINAIDVVYNPSSDTALSSNNVADALEELEGMIGTGGTNASTTEVLTGTDAAKIVTPDALAALWEKGSNVTSASTVSLGEGGFFHITGTTTITDIDWATAKDGRAALVVFDGALTLTHNATTLKLPGGANITTVAGDRAIFVQDSSDNVVCVGYFRASGQPIVPSTTGAPVSLTIAASDESTALTTGTAKVTFRMPHAVTLTAVRASLTTAQSSGSVVTVDINESGSTILSTKLTFDNTEKTTTTAATPAVISDTSLADDAEITIDIDQVGDGTATGLKITLIGTR